MAKDEITRRQFGHLATRMLTGGALAMNLNSAREPELTLKYDTDTAKKSKKKGDK